MFWSLFEDHFYEWKVQEHLVKRTLDQLKLYSVDHCRSLIGCRLHYRLNQVAHQAHLRIHWCWIPTGPHRKKHQRARHWSSCNLWSIGARSLLSLSLTSGQWHLRLELISQLQCYLWSAAGCYFRGSINHHLLGVESVSPLAYSCSLTLTLHFARRFCRHSSPCVSGFALWYAAATADFNDGCLPEQTQSHLHQHGPKIPRCDW